MNGKYQNPLKFWFLYTCVIYLYIIYRLGEPEKATYHYKHAGQEADQYDLAKVKSLQTHLNKCTEARRLRDWNTLIKETESAISAGADSAPQVNHFSLFSKISTPILMINDHNANFY